MKLREYSRLSCLLGLTSFAISMSSVAHCQTQPVEHMAHTTQPPALMLGSAWYPEQWPESRWEADLQLMQDAHMHFVRLGEFAWARLEPKEGQFDMDWMERAINLAGKHGIFVVIGTPSCAPPAWLSTKYPEVLVTSESGEHATHGGRNNFNWDNQKYRQLVRQIDEKLAQKFGHNPYVIGWQIDNEYSRVSYDSATRADFQTWMRQRYGTLDNLNQALTTAYWSETFLDWNQIPAGEKGNPGLMLDWKRFVSDTWRSYQKNQIDALRQFSDPRQKITTNMMGWFDGFDHYTVSKDLDIASWDDPQVFGHVDVIRNGAAHDLTRGFKGQNFWVMETTAGPRGGMNASVMLDKGAMRAAMWHDIGHGADVVSYWQWRDALNGQEQNHGAIVDVDGLPDQIYPEVSQVGEEFDKASPVLKQTRVEAKVAIVHSYDSRWTINWQRMNPDYDPIAELLSYYKPLHDLGNSIDVVSPTSDLSKYTLVVAPGLNVLTRAAADNLRSYVEHGGHLVLGQRSGMKDDSNARWPQRQPGPLTDILGARVEQYEALDKPIDVSGAWGNAKGSLMAESLTSQAPGVEVLMRYSAPHTWFDQQPAAITRRVGKGSIAYIGAWLDDAAMKRAAEWMLKQSGTTPDLFPVPTGVEVYRRTGSGKNVFILDNFTREEQTVTLPGSMRDVLGNATVGSVRLPAYGVAVLAAEHEMSH